MKKYLGPIIIALLAFGRFMAVQGEGEQEVNKALHLVKGDKALHLVKGDKPFQKKSEFKFPKKYQMELKDYRKNWTRLTNYEFSGLHWKQFIVIYINKEPINYVKNYIEYGRVYLDDEDDEEGKEEKGPVFIKYPVGTIFLKEHFISINGKPSAAASTVIMKKREKGYDPENGDWEYAQFAVDGTVIMEGDSKNPAIKAACADCHKNMEDRDYIFATYSILELKK